MSEPEVLAMSDSVSYARMGYTYEVETGPGDVGNLEYWAHSGWSHKVGAAKLKKWISLLLGIDLRDLDGGFD
jgi:hypothetical protein